MATGWDRDMYHLFVAPTEEAMMSAMNGFGASWRTTDREKALEIAGAFAARGCYVRVKVVSSEIAEDFVVPVPGRE